MIESCRSCLQSDVNAKVSASVGMQTMSIPKLRLHAYPVSDVNDTVPGKNIDPKIAAWTSE